MKTSESMKNIAPALVAFQSEVQDPRKSSDNPFFKSKYVELNELMAAVKPVANKHGLFINQDITTELTENGKLKVWCRTRLSHVSGEFIESSGQFTIAKGTDPQSSGSSQTYIRRYDISAFLGLSWEKDDDGNAGSQSEQQQVKNTRQHTRQQDQQPRKENSSRPTPDPDAKDDKAAETELPYRIPEVKDKPNESQINGLEAMCQYLGRSPERMAKYYKVNSLKEMQTYTFRLAYKELAKFLLKEGYQQGPDLNWHKA
ncbi:ERF family protein [Acidaminococcus sp.]|uniref:ERF family protein n=1 Tax=Acidaminococcus sp. TaxID=1872103 RepID=UPI003D7D9541